MKLDKNISQWAIAKELTILSKFQGTGSVSDRPRCARARKLHYKMVRKLIRKVKVESKKTARQVIYEPDMSN